MKKRSNLFFAVFTFVLLTGCLSSKEFTGDAAALGNDVVIVGSIELSPPLRDGEQDFPPTTIGLDLITNAVFFQLGPQVSGDQGINVTNTGRFSNAKFGKVFFLKEARHDRLFLSSSLMYKAILRTRTDYLYFPGYIEIEVPQGARFLYIGTIRYVRDVYDAVTKIEIVDDLDGAKKAMEKQFGGQFDLQRAKVIVHEK